MRGGIRLYFYPRPPRGGRLLRLDQTIDQQAISIHALREEGDQNSTTKPVCLKIFLSTPSARRATPTGPRKNVESKISIHALREEGDPRLYRGTADAGDFYPRPPRGGRLDVLSLFGVSLRFLSTPSARRATTTTGQMIAVPDNFYPRPPRGGRRLAPVPRFALRINFYPRPPRGGRRLVRYTLQAAGLFLSTPSARRATAHTA